MIGAIVGGVAVLIGALGLAWLLLRPPPPVTGAGAVVAYGGGSDQPLAGWVAGRGPTSIAAAGEILWVANIDSGTVAHVDKRSGSGGAIGHVAAHPADVHVIGDQLWVADPYSDRVSVLSADDGMLLHVLDLHAQAVTGVGRNAWLADDLRDRLIRVDTQTFALVEEIALPGPAGPASLAMVEDTIWVAAPRAGGIIRVDAAGADPVLQPLDIGRVTVVAAIGDQLWAASRSADTVARIETDGRVAARQEVCDAPVAIAPFAGGAWVACATERALWQLDESVAVQMTISLDGVPTDILAVDDRIWVTLRGN